MPILRPTPPATTDPKNKDMITTSFYRLQLFHKVTDSFEDDLHKETYYQFKQLAILEYLKDCNEISENLIRCFNPNKRTKSRPRKKRQLS